MVMSLQDKYTTCCNQFDWGKLECPIHGDGVTADVTHVTHFDPPLRSDREFKECDTCKTKAGMPVLCSGCLHNRYVIVRSNGQNTIFRLNSETKECGLEDENAGETLSDRPLVVGSLPDDLELEGDPAAWDANLNMRDWVRLALVAKGAIFTGGGFGAEYSDIDIELEGMRFNIRITPR